MQNSTATDEDLIKCVYLHAQQPVSNAAMTMFSQALTLQSQTQDSLTSDSHISSRKECVSPQQELCQSITEGEGK